MAQLVERLVRNEKAAGSNPTISTTNNLKRTYRFGLLFFYALFPFDINLNYTKYGKYDSLHIFRSLY